METNEETKTTVEGPDYSECGMPYAAIFSDVAVDPMFVRAAEIALSEGDRRIANKWCEEIKEARTACYKQREHQQAALAGWFHQTHPDKALSFKIAVRTKVKVNPGEPAYRYIYVDVEKLR